MVTKREKMRNRLLASKRDIFLYQTAILRSQSGRKLNARDYEAVVSAHHQSPSVYDNPEGVVRTARLAETLASMDDCNDASTEVVSTLETADHIKRSKLGGRPRVKGHRPGQSGSAPSVINVKRSKQLPTAENPYAKPTYRSFEWLLSSRRRCSVGSEDAPAVKQKRRRKNLFDSNASSSLGKSMSINESCTTDSSYADSGVGKLFLDVTGSDTTSQGHEPSLNRSPPASNPDRKSDDGKVRLDFAGSVSTLTRKEKNVFVNGVVSGGESLIVSTSEPCSSTALKNSPLRSFDETSMPNHTSSPSQSSPRFNMSKLNARHFSDILVDRASPSRSRTTSLNDEDAYIDVVSDVPILSSTSTHSVTSQHAIRNGFADGLARLAKVKAKKHLVAGGGGLVNGLRQGTLDSFVRRVPNGNRCPNGIDDDTPENSVRTENEHHSSASSVKLKQSAADRTNADGETSDKSPASDGQTAVDNFVDIESIEGVWRRRTSLRSSTAFMSLLGPDLAELT